MICQTGGLPSHLPIPACSDVLPREVDVFSAPQVRILRAESARCCRISSRVVSVTRVLEALAASIGSGLVIGGFIGGAGSFAWTRSRTVSEEWALIGGYVGGLVALASPAVDIVVKRFV